MTADRISDEMLVAFADGEADEATIEAVTKALQGDEALAKRLDAFMMTRQILKTHLDPVARETVPDALTRFVMSGGAPTAAANKAMPGNAPRRGWMALPMAAAVAGIVAGGLGYWVGAASPTPAAGVSLAALTAAGSALTQALDSAPDGAAGAVAPVQSYDTAAGFCRSFGVSESDAARWRGVACREPAGWRVQVVAAAPREDGALRPASGGVDAIEAYLDGVQAGDALTPEAVREQIAKNWRTKP